MTNFTFKKQEKATGLMAVGEPYPNVDIKLNKKICGYISAPTWNSQSNKWLIRFSVIKKDIMEDGNSNCSWRWITLKKQSETEQEARDFLKIYADKIIEKYDLHFFED